MSMHGAQMFQRIGEGGRRKTLKQKTEEAYALDLKHVKEPSRVQDESSLKKGDRQFVVLIEPAIGAPVQHVIIAPEKVKLGTVRKHLEVKYDAVGKYAVKFNVDGVTYNSSQPVKAIPKSKGGVTSVRVVGPQGFRSALNKETNTKSGAAVEGPRVKTAPTPAAARGYDAVAGRRRNRRRGGGGGGHGSDPIVDASLRKSLASQQKQVEVAPAFSDRNNGEKRKENVRYEFFGQSFVVEVDIDPKMTIKKLKRRLADQGMMQL